jgi:hypothetical protein
MRTEPLDNFLYYYKRLDALFTEICAPPDPDVQLTVTVSSLVRELALVQLVAMIDVYRADLMRLIFKSNTRYLQDSREKYHPKDVLELGNWEALETDMIERETQQWTKNVAFARWIENVRNRSLLPQLNLSASAISQVEEIIATRNTLAHNRGRIDAEYIRRSKHWYGIMKRQQPNIGTNRELDNEYYIQSSMCIKHVIEEIDKAAVQVI